MDDEEEGVDDELDDDEAEELGVEGAVEFFDVPDWSDVLDVVVEVSPFVAVVVLAVSLVSFFSVDPSFFSESALPPASSCPGGFNLSE